MPGIARFNITDTITGRGAHRFDDSRALHPAANLLYASIFEGLDMPLAAGSKTIDCTKREFEAGYDYALGIDVVLTFMGGQTATMQEKFLFTTFNTITVEYMQDWRTDEPGDWFNMKCQYYFVGYAPNKRNFTNWILVDWLRLMQSTMQNRVPWELQNNKEDGARASFKHVKFDRVPLDCIVGRGQAKPVDNAPDGWPWTKWTGDPGPGPCKKCTARDYWRSPKNNKYVCRNCHTVNEITIA